MQHISVLALSEVLEREAHNPAVDFINVCTSTEYAETHIPGVRSVPLDEIERQVAQFADKTTIYVHCRTGGRSRMAIQQLESLGISAELVNVEGGILAWQGAGLPTNSKR